MLTRLRSEADGGLVLFCEPDEEPWRQKAPAKLVKAYDLSR